MRRAPPVHLTRVERRRLLALSEGPGAPSRIARRARIVLRAARGLENLEIAGELRTTARTVGLWRRRFLSERVPGLLSDAPRSGRPPTVPTTTIELIRATARGPPPPGAPAWTARELARRFRVSKTTVLRIRARDRRTPAPMNAPRRDAPERSFMEGVTDLVGLFLDPPERAMAFSVDPRGRGPSLPPPRERRRAARPRRASPAEFRAFLQRIDHATPPHLEVHLLVDRRPGPPAPIVARWLVRHPRFHLHVLPPGRSSPTLFDRTLFDLRRKHVGARTPSSAARLHAAVERYFGALAPIGEPLVWTATSEEIDARGPTRVTPVATGTTARR